MALMHLTRFSDTLQTHMNISVILPDKLPSGPLAVIWLLHGLGESGTVWERRTNIEDIAINYQVAVIMPNVDRSFYMNEINGLPYWDYLTKELMPEMQRLLPISSQRSQNFVVGNSMGGFGALKLGFTHPEWFSAVAALSPAIDLDDIIPIMPDIGKVFGSSIPTHYLFNLMQAASKTELQEIQWYRAIGTADFLYEANQQFSTAMQANHLNETYKTRPGDHDWSFWNEEIKQVFEWLPLERLN